VVGFVLLVAAVPVAAYFVLRWYAYDNWIVTLQGDQVIVLQGQPGGVLWFHPKIVDHTGVTTTQILPAAIAPLQAGVQESSLSAAENYYKGLETTTTPAATAPTKTTTTTKPPVGQGTPAGAATTTTARAPTTTTTTTVAVP
jgi:hypothetical protein